MCILVEDDFTFPHEARRRAEDILVEKKATYFIQVFSGACHGFATRPDPELKGESECSSCYSAQKCLTFTSRMGEGRECAGDDELVQTPRKF